jgi:hypothetical protein
MPYITTTPCFGNHKGYGIINYGIYRANKRRTAY